MRLLFIPDREFGFRVSISKEASLLNLSQPVCLLPYPLRGLPDTLLDLCHEQKDAYHF